VSDAQPIQRFHEASRIKLRGVCPWSESDPCHASRGVAPPPAPRDSAPPELLQCGSADPGSQPTICRVQQSITETRKAQAHTWSGPHFCHVRRMQESIEELNARQKSSRPIDHAKCSEVLLELFRRNKVHRNPEVGGLSSISRHLIKDHSDPSTSGYFRRWQPSRVPFGSMWLRWCSHPTK